MKKVKIIREKTQFPWAMFGFGLMLIFVTALGYLPCDSSFVKCVAGGGALILLVCFCADNTKVVKKEEIVMVEELK